MEELENIDVELKDLKIIKSIFARYLPYKQVWAYGSRVKWTATHTSDLDCVVFGASDSEIADAKEAFDESDIAFEVQILNWETIPDDFKENIKEQYFILQSKRDWKETTLGEIAYINPIERLAKGTNAPKITMDALQPFTKKISYLSFEEYRGGAKFRNGDTLVARITPCLENGKTAYVSILKSGELGFGSTEFIILREKAKKSDKNFLYYFATSANFRDVAILAMTGSSGRQRVQINALTSHLFRFPPLPEQKAIASVLSSLDDKIDLLHRQNKTLESIAESLFRQWFIEEAQDDWEEVKLGDFIVPKKGKNITKSQAIDGQYPVIAGGLNPSCYHNQCNTSAPVITISASGANAGFVNLHYIPVWSSDSSFIDSATTNDVYFFYMFLKYFQEDIYDKQEGSAQPHIYPSHLINLDILKYPLVLIENYNINVIPFFNKIQHNQGQIKTLESLRDTLLPKLMSGDVRVKYDEVA